ncbi:hypothetical protein [Planctomycetes bacterium Poly30]
MTLATVGWGIVWGSLAVAKIGWAPPAPWVYAAAGIPGILGLVYAFLTIRARRTWLFMALVAIFANGSLIALPFLFGAEFTEALASMQEQDPAQTSRSAP